MTISQKLTNVNDTKLNIKNAIIDQGVDMTGVPFTDYHTKIAEIEGGGDEIISDYYIPDWPRPKEWPELPDISQSPQTFVGLYDISNIENGNLVNIRLSVSGSGGNAYIDWGDGVIDSIPPGGNIDNYHTFDINSNQLISNTVILSRNAPASAVIEPSHGRQVGDKIYFFDSTISAIKDNKNYYIIETGLDWYKISETHGGSQILFGEDGTARLTRNKFAIVQIYCDVDISITNIDFTKTNGKAFVRNYSNAWLEMHFNLPNSIFAISNTSTTTGTYNHSLRSIVFFDISASPRRLEVLYGLENVVSYVQLADTHYRTFYFCYKLKYCKIYDCGTSNISAEQMFSGCNALEYVYLDKTSYITSVKYMFANCHALQYLRPFDLSNCSDFTYMFYVCFSLREIPEFDLINYTSSYGSTFPAHVSGSHLSATSVNRCKLKNINGSYINFRWMALSGDALNEIYSNLVNTVSSKTISVADVYGTSTHNPSIATAKGWTVST